MKWVEGGILAKVIQGSTHVIGAEDSKQISKHRNIDLRLLKFALSVLVVLHIIGKKCSTVRVGTCDRIRFSNDLTESSRCSKGYFFTCLGIPLHVRTVDFRVDSAKGRYFGLITNDGHRLAKDPRVQDT